MKEALATGKDLLLNHFSNVRRWSEVECYKSRQVWIECLGVPPHGWPFNNFKHIGELRGKVIALDNNAESNNDLSAARLLVETCVFSTIQAWFKLSLGRY